MNTEYDVYGTMRVVVHKRVTARTAQAAMRNAQKESTGPWWFGDDNPSPVTVVSADEVFVTAARESDSVEFTVNAEVTR